MALGGLVRDGTEFGWDGRPSCYNFSSAALEV